MTLIPKINIINRVVRAALTEISMMALFLHREISVTKLIKKIKTLTADPLFCRDSWINSCEFSVKNLIANTSTHFTILLCMQCASVATVNAVKGMHNGIKYS